MKQLFAVVVVALFAVGCGFTVGDGDVVTRDRTLEGITGVVNDSMLEVVVEPGTGQATLTIDQNLHDDVYTRVTDGILVVDTSDGIYPSFHARLTVYAEQLTRIETDGAGSVRVAGAAPVDELLLNVDGLGSIHYEGAPERLIVLSSGAGSVFARSTSDAPAASVQIDVDGSGSVDTSKLAAVDLSVTSNGLGSVDARIAGGDLHIVVDGAGSVTWRGTASTIDIDDDGLGRVVHGS